MRRRQILAAEHHRPRYHFLPPDAWMNDPNGVVRWKGQYHLFYQHNPHAARWAAPHWGHAVSEDLVYWRDLPIALTPDAEPRDDGGCYSGVAVDDGGTPVIVYTGVKDGEQRTCLAFGDETLTNWRKFEGNPVQRFPQGLEAGERFDNAYRDPFVWRQDGIWYQIIGTSLFGRGQVLLYRSVDLKTWEYLHPFVPQKVRDELGDIGKAWECPNFFAAGDKHVLIVSLYTGKLPYTIALLGSYHKQQFFPERVQRFDWGLDCLYAPLSMDDSGRRLAWGWLQEQRSPKEQLRSGWAGVMSLPRVLSLGEDGGFHSKFAPELEKLREKKLYEGDLEPNGTAVLPDVRGRQLELRLTLTRGQASLTGLSVCRSPGGEEETLVYIDWEKSKLVVDKERSSLNLSAYATVEVGDLPIKEDRVSLHLYLDASVLEVVADNQVALTTRLYPAREDSNGVQLFSQGEGGTCNVKVWQLGSIW